MTGLLDLCEEGLEGGLNVLPFWRTHRLVTADDEGVLHELVRVLELVSIRTLQQALRVLKDVVCRGFLRLVARRSRMENPINTIRHVTTKRQLLNNDFGSIPPTILRQQ